jgi:hypothetical protein
VDEERGDRCCCGWWLKEGRDWEGKARRKRLAEKVRRKRRVKKPKGRVRMGKPEGRDWLGKTVKRVWLRIFKFVANLSTLAS